MRVGALAVVLAFGTGVAPVPTHQHADMVFLEATAIFDRDTYQAGETTHLTVVVTNTGRTEVTGITARCAGNQGGPELRGGEGWGPLAEGGPGLTVPAGGTRTVAVSEPVPDGSPRHGYVSASSCSIEAEGASGTGLTARANVPGLSGSGQGRIFQDHNANFDFDDGEAIAGVPVGVTDPNTGAVVARPVTDDGGSFTATNLPADEYDVRIDGPWRFQFDGFRLPVVAGDPVPALDFAVVPGPAEPRPNLKVSAAFDKAAYNSGDDVRTRITVTNIGEAAATGVHASWGGSGPGLMLSTESWGELSRFKRVRIEPAETRVFEVVGPIREPGAGVVLFSAALVGDGTDANVRNNGFQLVAPVTETRGTFTGIVYVDQNNSNTMDPGEGFGAVPVHLHGRLPHSFKQITDAQGRFAFRDIPTGRYYVSYDAVGAPLSDEVMVDEHDDPDLLVRIARPLSEFLTASVRFTERSYTAGETAHLTVTLSNRGAGALTGITALCTGVGNGNEIGSEPAGWGELGYQASGVTIGARETRTFTVWSPVPQGAVTYGYVVAGCHFGAPPERMDGPGAIDMAKVPGGVGAAAGRLIHDRDSDGPREEDGVADTKVVLVDNDTGKVVARAKTDTQGRFTFGDMPAGQYGVRAIGPWKHQHPGATFQVIAGLSAEDRWKFPDSWVIVVPGPNQPDPDAPPEADPAPQGGVAPAASTGGGGRSLASTGASVVNLVVAGLAALVIGLGLLLVRRRQEDGFIRPNR